jgi:DNA-binding Xre family transcriptional regulator
VGRIPVIIIIGASCQLKTVSSIQFLMLRIRLREAMEAHRERTGVRFTYRTLAEASGLSVSTLQSLAARPTYNTRLSTVERLCTALQCSPGELLELTGGNDGDIR